MEYDDRTSMGGSGQAFLTTHWSLIEQAQQDEDKDRALIGLLLQRYWKPVYCYLRRRGHDNEQAKDLTQGFFHEVVLNRDLIGRVDPSKGRFRTLLLHALRQYLADERRKETTRKRIPKDRLVSLEIIEPEVLPETVLELGPEQAFDYAWKTELLGRVLSEVEDRYVTRQKEKHWYVFRDRILTPTLEDNQVPSLAQLCERYDIPNEAQASNMLTTVKRHFQNVLREHVRQTVLTGEAAEEELKEIFRFLEP
jgi:DNA-directed RNA polymerase specialized sigma24 family protein